MAKEEEEEDGENALLDASFLRLFFNSLFNLLFLLFGLLFLFGFQALKDFIICYAVLFTSLRGLCSGCGRDKMSLRTANDIQVLLGNDS